MNTDIIIHRTDGGALASVELLRADKSTEWTLYGRTAREYLTRALTDRSEKMKSGRKTSKRIIIREEAGELVLDLLHDGYNIIERSLYGEDARRWLTDEVLNTVY